ncbi:DUF6812 domain-containing protein [Coleofasciculus chthonoplastes]|uniref:DUF6812 domain-containing protein n=1 Tax=Coleofasciculus chthonoplastes TaxID=64178 RepID=UPI0032F9FB80
MRVQILTLNNVQIFGDMAVSALPNSYRSRLSDMLNNSRKFIVLTDVEIHQQEQPLTQMSSLCINKPAIAFLCEAEMSSISSHTWETDFVSAGVA